MPEYITRAHFDGAVATIREDIRQFVAHFNKSQGEQNKRFDRMDGRFDEIETHLKDHDARFDDLDAKLGLVVEDISAERHLHNLVDVLRKEGLSIDERDVFSH